MLLGEHGGRHENRDLFAVVDGLEGGANRNFGFAVAHVAADEAIRGFGLLEVRLGFENRLHLVGRFLVGERSLELALPVGIGGERVAGNGLPHRLNLDHLGSHVADRFADAILTATPRHAPELGEFRLRVRPADVALHEVDPRRGNVQEHAVAELEDQVLFLGERGA